MSEITNSEEYQKLALRYHNAVSDLRKKELDVERLEGMVLVLTSTVTALLKKIPDAQKVESGGLYE